MNSLGTLLCDLRDMRACLACLCAANGDPATGVGVLLLNQVFLDGLATVVVGLVPLELATLLGHIRDLKWTLGFSRTSCGREK